MNVKAVYTNCPMGRRGYSPAAVDRYVEQVNRLIAELEISASPGSAVRHALDARARRPASC
ncbi:MAG: hypothetical protein JO243_14375 [Solirubrobacterales bacterium]|nr:hypothetical protein [Solirubrobacterales bacterium]